VRHFVEELEDLQKQLLEMAGMVELAIHESVLSLTERDRERAQRDRVQRPAQPLPRQQRGGHPRQLLRVALLVW